MKLCTKCNIEKPLEEMTTYKTGNRIGYRSVCKKCENARVNAWRKTPEGKIKHAAMNKEWRDSNPDKVQRIRLRQSAKQLGLDPDVIEKHYEEHDKLCEICGKSGDDAGRRLAIDHDHLYFGFRGLLCYNCNLMLGHASDNPAILQSGIEYLIKKLNAAEPNVKP